MKLKDKKETSIRPSYLTSCYLDKEHLLGPGIINPAITITIGSCPIKLVYEKKEDRDSDLLVLNKILEKST